MVPSQVSNPRPVNRKSVALPIAPSFNRIIIFNKFGVPSIVYTRILALIKYYIRDEPVIMFIDCFNLFEQSLGKLRSNVSTPSTALWKARGWLAVRHS